MFRSLGLKRPKVDPAIADRIPPGQYLTERWPVLHYGDVPDFFRGCLALETFRCSCESSDPDMGTVQ